MIDTYQYFDYRKLLKDLYQERKSQDGKFSYRYICLKSGIRSPGYFSNVLAGKSNISLKVVLKLSQVFGLKRPEAEYFELLVLFNQAKTHDEKTLLFDRILKLKKSKVKTLDASYYELFSHWYYPAIRECLDFHAFRGDCRELSQMISPAITPREAERAITVLETLGLIRRNEQGVYERVEALASTGDEVRSMAIVQFQKDTLELAKRSYDAFPLEARDNSTLTISISKRNFAKVKDKIRSMRREILELAKSDDDTDTVFHLNFIAFPLTRWKEST